MSRGLTDRPARALVTGLAAACAAICAAVPGSRAAPDPFAYGFAPLSSPEAPAEPHPAIAARYSAAYRACQDDPKGTTYSLDMCDQAEMKVQDDALNRQWRRTLARLAPPSIGRLRAAERAWIEGRRAQCDAAANQYAGGTMMPLAYGGCYVDETIRRTIWLERLRG